MKNLLTTVALATALFSSAVAHAGTLSGTFGFTLNGVTVTPATTGGVATPLDPYTGIQSINFTSASFGTSSPLFPSPMTGTISGSTALYPNNTNGGNGTPFTLIFANYGTFVETSNPILVTQSTDPQTLALKLVGVFTPGTALATYTGGTSQIVLQFTQSTSSTGTSYSGSGTFSINPTTLASAPEPSSLMLMGTGLLSAAGAAFRKRRTLLS